MTRALQTKLRVSDRPLVYLLDTPGIMMPNIKNIEVGFKLAACGMTDQSHSCFIYATNESSCTGTLKDENVGVIHVADYILYQLNKGNHFDYVDHFKLSEPKDRVFDLLCEIANTNNFVRKMASSVTGWCFLL